MQEYRLSDIVEVIGGGTPKRSNADFWGGSIPWLSVADFNNDSRKVHSSEERITELGLKKSSTKLLDTGQLIISARGTVGALAQLSRPMAFNQSCYGINARQEITKNDFLYYLLKYSVSNFKQVTHGAVFNTITRQTFDLIKVQLPPLKEQTRIAEILGAIDDKVELNLKMNKTLEEMAQALYKEWFVDFGPVIDKARQAGNEVPPELETKAAKRRHLGPQETPYGLDPKTYALFPDSFEDSELGPIPRGWEVSSIGKEFQFQNGYAFKSKELIDSETEDTMHIFKMGNIKRGGGFNSKGTKSFYPKSLSLKLGRYILKKGDVLISMTDMKASMALLGHTAIMPVDDLFLVNQRVGMIRSIDSGFLEYPFLYIFSNLPQTIENLRQQANSGVQVNLSTSAIKEFQLLLPSRSIHDLFHKKANRVFEKTFQNQKENQTLTQTRDTLLPKLISGEVRVKCQ